MARPAASPLRAALSPTRLLFGGLDPSGRTGRAGFAAVALLVGGLWGLRAWGPSTFEGWSRAHEALATVPLALLLVPGLGQAFRRLNDAGWRGAWAWLLLLPWARGALVLLLLVLPSSQRRRRGDGPGRTAGLGAAGLAGLLLLASLLWTTAPVVAGGMTPALRPGDLALVRRAPLTLSRGDVIAFRLPGEALPRMARVVGLPGETVAVEGGLPAVDGARATHAEDGFFTETFARSGPLRVMPTCGNGTVGLGAACTTRAFVETLPGGHAAVVLDAGPRPLDQAAPVAVPEGALFVLGDHRDASQDSRRAPGAQGTGLVPLAGVLGRVDRVLASTAAASPWDPRGWRPGRLLERVR